MPISGRDTVHCFSEDGGMKGRSCQKVSEASAVQKVVLWKDAVARPLLAETWGLDRVMIKACCVFAKLSQTRYSSCRFIELALLVAVTLVIAACSEQHETKQTREAPSQGPPTPAIGGTYRRPLGQDPSSLDPVKLVDLY